MCTGAIYTLLALREKCWIEKQQRILPLRSNVSIMDVVQSNGTKGPQISELEKNFHTIGKFYLFMQPLSDLLCLTIFWPDFGIYVS